MLKAKNGSGGFFSIHYNSYEHLPSVTGYSGTERLDGLVTVGQRKRGERRNSEYILTDLVINFNLLFE